MADRGPAVEAFAARLAHLRQRQGLSMRALAERAGMHSSEISRLENVQRDPRLSTMVRLAQALDIPLAGLLLGLQQEAVRRR